MLSHLECTTFSRVSTICVSLVSMPFPSEVQMILTWNVSFVAKHLDFVKIYHAVNGLKVRLQELGSHRGQNYCCNDWTSNKHNQVGYLCLSLMEPFFVHVTLNGSGIPSYKSLNPFELFVAFMGNVL